MKEQPMAFAPVTFAQWRKQVDEELAGKSYEKVLVQQTFEGIPIAPLYTEAPGARLPAPPPSAPFRVCMRHDGSATQAELSADLDGGADALWLPLASAPDALRGRTFFVFDVDGAPAVERLLGPSTGPNTSFALNWDPIGARAAFDGAALATVARAVAERAPGSTSVMASTLPYHLAGADAADELACALAAGTRYLGALLDAGLSPQQAAGQIALQTSVGRDTFLELCKVRALRACWSKVLAASGAPDAPRTLVHAVCSPRTLAARDPWVNMLRTTTQVFAGVLGGADLVTPSPFDEALGRPSAMSRRVARNTGLVLREESFLGKVNDPAGGAYFFESLTDALAREVWRRFQAIEKDGGIVAQLASGALDARFEKSWRERLDAVAKRKLPILGVSEFANLTEQLPTPAAATSPLTAHRDAFAFEKLRTRADATHPEAVLVTLGSFAESRARAGFAAGFFAAGGIRTRESSADVAAPLVCLCGSDERYAAEAVDRARALKAAGCGRVMLAGRPGALEGALRAAGVDGFLFVGCDVVATLAGILELS